MSLLDQIKAKQKDLDSKRSKDFSVTPPPGNSRWRILPHWSGDVEQLPAHDFGQHFIKDPVTKEVKAVIVCSSKTYGEPCEVCKDVVDLKTSSIAAGDESMANFYWEARAGQKHVVNAVRWEKASGYADEVVTLSLPVTAFEQLMGIVSTYYAEDVNLFDAEKGHDIIIIRSGTGRSTTYSVQAAPTSSVVPAKLVAKAQDLDEYVNQITEEKTRIALSVLRGGAPAAAPAALPHMVTAGTAAPAVTATTATTAAATVSSGPESIADSLGDVDLDELDLDDLVQDDLADVM